MKLNQGKMASKPRGSNGEWFTEDLGIVIIHVHNFSGVWECKIVSAKSIVKSGFESKEDATAWAMVRTKHLLNSLRLLFNDFEKSVMAEIE